MYKLLIAEDEQLERQALRFIIEKNITNIQVVGETGDGVSAIHISESEKPDIVLMDIRMPGINGLEAAKAIRDLLPDTVIIMLTAMEEFSYAKEALTIGAAQYLLKPVRPDDLIRVLSGITVKIGEARAKKEEEIRLRKSVEEAIPFIQMSFVYDLISGNIKEIAQFRERSRFLGIKIDFGVALVIDVENFKQLTDSDTELEKQILKQRIYQLVCNVVNERGLVSPFSSDKLVILLGFKENYTPEFIKDDVHKTATMIREAILNVLNISIRIGIGRYYNNPLELHKSYLEAINAEQQRFFIGDSQIIHVEDIPYLSKGPFNYPFHYERAVLDKVRSGDRKQARKALRELLNEIFESKASMETVKACVLELLVVLSRAAVEGGANLDQLTLLNFKGISGLNSCHSKEQVEQWMLDSLDSFMDNMLKNRSSINVRVINKACDYITENCHRNISLEEVAQTVHLSHFYFSRLFKQEKGYNFVDFITKVRVDRAKVMLQDPDYTVVQIATEVGYQDASYFCRVFRHATNMTPKQYRSEIRKNKTGDEMIQIEAGR
ncbi:response regulator [Pelosinus sp. sgz500959]|uniref:response regulator transcription factor n=1 Tax=Pelosinus sp. sgz500959 TaxID=3242472 RepID=UPI00366ADB1C